MSEKGWPSIPLKSCNVLFREDDANEKRARVHGAPSWQLITMQKSYCLYIVYTTELLEGLVISTVRAP